MNDGAFAHANHRRHESSPKCREVGDTTRKRRSARVASGSRPKKRARRPNSVQSDLVGRCQLPGQRHPPGTAKPEMPVRYPRRRGTEVAMTIPNHNQGTRHQSHQSPIGPDMDKQRKRRPQKTVTSPFYEKRQTRRFFGQRHPDQSDGQKLGRAIARRKAVNVRPRRNQPSPE